MSVKCIVCMDSKYLAVSTQDSNIVVPMLTLTGSELSEYRLESCTCIDTSKSKRHEEKESCVQEKIVV